MARIESYAPGDFCWAELQTSDPAAAKKFYGDMFGWEAVDFPMPQGAYTMLRIGADDVGALTGMQPGAPPHWGVYFATADIEESAAKIGKLGGKVIAGPFDVMDAGRMLVAHDPQGAFFSLWQAGRHIGATYGGPLNQIVWPELGTPDPTAAVAFYGALLGWGTKPDSGFDSAMYIEWQHGGRSIGGLLPMKGDEWKGVPPHWGVYVTVSDCDERAAKATSLGAKLCVPPRDIPNTGRFSLFSDPQGAMISIIHLTHTGQPATA